MLAFVSLLVLVVAAVRHQGLALPIALAGGVPLGVAFIVGGNGMAVGSLFGMLALVSVVLRPGPWVRGGIGWLYAFTAWAVAITAVAPGLFRGTLVLPGSLGIDQAILTPAELTYSKSNFAQVIYLILGVAVVVYLMRSPTTRSDLVGWALGLTVGLSFLKFAMTKTGLPWPDGLFDNSPNFRYIDTTSTGDQRFRGILSEPSGLASTCIVALAFFVPFVLQVKGRARAWGSAVIAMAVVVLTVSTATTAVVGGLVVLTAAALWQIGRFTVGRRRISPVALASTLSLIALGILVLAIVGGPLVRSMTSGVQDKLTSTSFSSRSGADHFSYHLLLESGGLGLGLGSNRPSSFIPMLLSCLGVVGLVLFIVAMANICIPAWRLHDVRPTIYAILALLLVKCVVGSDLNAPVLFIGLGVCAHAVYHRTGSLPTAAGVPIPRRRLAQSR